LEQVKYEAEQAVAQAKGQAESRIANATAEAEAIKIQAQAITSQGGKDYVELKRIEAWGKGGALVPNTLITGSDAGNFLLNLTQ
jgi:regulator of protease activity HflC (stomatin/prohibitin superfamily)